MRQDPPMVNDVLPLAITHVCSFQSQGVIVQLVNRHQLPRISVIVGLSHIEYDKPYWTLLLNTTLNLCATYCGTGLRAGDVRSLSGSRNGLAGLSGFKDLYAVAGRRTIGGGVR